MRRSDYSIQEKEERTKCMLSYVRVAHEVDAYICKGLVRGDDLVIESARAQRFVFNRLAALHFAPPSS